MRVPVYKSKVSHFPFLRNGVCCQSWHGPWALHGHKIPRQVSPMPGCSPECVWNPPVFAWPFPSLPLLTPIAGFSPLQTSNSFHGSCTLWSTQEFRKQIYRHNCVHGVNATCGGQLGNKEPNTNFPVLCTSKKACFSLKCLFEVWS